MMNMDVFCYLVIHIFEFKCLWNCAHQRTYFFLHFNECPPKMMRNMLNKATTLSPCKYIRFLVTYQ